MAIDAAVTIGSILLPPVVDFVKKKFLKPDSDTPEATLSSLATTKPDVMPDYLNAVVNHLKAKVEWFNRDVIGAPSQWVVDLRASIRPIVVVVGIMALCLPYFQLEEGVRWFFEGAIGSWMGSRLVKSE